MHFQISQRKSVELVTPPLGNFHLKSGAGRAKSFFASNTLVAYVAFLLLMVVLFLIVIRVGTSAMVALTAPPGSP